MLLEDSLEIVSSDDIRPKRSRAGIEAVLYDFISIEELVLIWSAAGGTGFVDQIGSLPVSS